MGIAKQFMEFIEWLVTYAPVILVLMAVAYLLIKIGMWHADFKHKREKAQREAEGATDAWWTGTD